MPHIPTGLAKNEAPRLARLRPEPPKDKQVRMTFRVSQALQKRFKLAVALSDEDPSAVLCTLMEQYVAAQDMSPDNIRRALAAD